MLETWSLKPKRPTAVLARSVPLRRRGVDPLQRPASTLSAPLREYRVLPQAFTATWPADAPEHVHRCRPPAVRNAVLIPTPPAARRTATTGPSDRVPPPGIGLRETPTRGQVVSVATWLDTRALPTRDFGGVWAKRLILSPKRTNFPSGPSSVRRSRKWILPHFPRTRL